MISGKNLTFATPKGKTIIENISMKVPKGEIVGLIGKNGAGKSTLIKVLSGLMEPTEGTIFIDNQKLEEYSAQELAKKRTVLSQEIPVSFNLSVLDILLLGRHPHGKLSTKDYEFVDEVIETLELQELLSTPYSSLSGGERQKIQFGRALCQLLPLGNKEDKILFLDEPLAALDLQVQQKILKHIKFLVKQYKLSILVVLHDLNYISHFCTHIYLLEQGRLVLDGKPAEVFTSENLERFFGVKAEIFKTEKEKVTMIF